MASAKPVVIALVFLVATLAGCLGGDDDPVDPGEGEERRPTTSEDGKPFLNATTTQIEQDLDAWQVVPDDDPEWGRPNVTKDDWLVLSTPVDPDGTVAGFKWQYPQDALLTTSGRSTPFLLLDFAITLDLMGASDGLTEGDDWLLVVLAERYDEDFSQWELDMVDYIYGVTTERTEGPFGQETDEVVLPPSKPFTMRVFLEDGVHGDNIYFVLAARGQGEFGMGVRPLNPAFAETSPPESPTMTWSDFREEVGDAPAFVPERTGAGEGLYIARYYQERATASTGLREITADMEEPEETLPTQDVYTLTSARDVTLRSATDGGWSRVSVAYTNIAEAGQWSLTGSVHGQAVDRQASFDHSNSLPGGDPPAMGLRAAVDGSDGTAIENHITKSGSLSETLRFEHIHIGAQLGELLDAGIPYRDRLF